MRELEPSLLTALEPPLEELVTSKTSAGLLNLWFSMLSIMDGPQGWADLPNDILHSIIGLLGSTRDLLAFIATCPNWQAAYMSAKSALDVLFPPLIFRKHAKKRGTADPNVPHTWELIDLAYPRTPLRRAIPPNILDTMALVGCSYGQAIFAHGSSDVILDVLTGTMVSAPHCPLIKPGYRALTAPVESPNSYLFVSDKYCLLAWRVGSCSWLHCRHPNASRNKSIIQIVPFKGRVFVMVYRKLYTVRFSPQKIRLEPLKVVYGDTMAPSGLRGTLVALDDELLLLASNKQAFFVDLSVQPAKYVKVKNGGLEKWAFFVAVNGFVNQPRHSMNPEMMGLKGSQVYKLHSNGLVSLSPAVGHAVEQRPADPRITMLNQRYSRTLNSFSAWV